MENRSSTPERIPEPPGESTGTRAPERGPTAPSASSSIEEAWAACEKSYMAAGFAALGGNKEMITAAFETHRGDLRALALAVLEKTLPRKEGCHCDDCVRCRAVRVRIEQIWARTSPDVVD